MPPAFCANAWPDCIAMQKQEQAARAAAVSLRALVTPAFTGNLQALTIPLTVTAAGMKSRAPETVSQLRYFVNIENAALRRARSVKSDRITTCAYGSLRITIQARPRESSVK